MRWFEHGVGGCLQKQKCNYFTFSASHKQSETVLSYSRLTAPAVGVGIDGYFGFDALQATLGKCYLVKVMSSLHRSHLVVVASRQVIWDWFGMCSSRKEFDVGERESATGSLRNQSPNQSKWFEREFQHLIHKASHPTNVDLAVWYGSRYGSNWSGVVTQYQRNRVCVCVWCQHANFVR